MIFLKDLRIVIPALNEEQSIGNVIDQVQKACEHAEIVVVDDGSSDDTATIALQKGVRVISNPSNYGYGKSLKIGFNSSSKNRRIKFLAFLDADNTYDPDIIPELYRLCKKESADIAVGSRLLARNSNMPLSRKLGNRFFAFLASIYSGKKITDVGTGIRVFKASLLPEVQNLPEDMSFTPAMTLKTMFLGLNYREIPINYGKRIGRSKLNSFTDGYSFLKIIVRSVKNHKPLAFFGTIGFSMLIGGFLLGLYSFIRYLGGVVFIPSFILTSLLVSIGLTALLFGLIADMIVDLRGLIEKIKGQ